MPSVSFTAIAQPDEGSVLLIEVPAAAVRKLGAKQRPPVRVTLNGVEYRSTIAVYGGRYYLPVRRELREAAKLESGKRAKVTLALDQAPRVVELPRDLAAALLKTAGATAAYRAMSFSHQREHVDWVTGAKRAETRRTRVAHVVADAIARSRAPRARGSRSSGPAAPRGS
jgi:hypothetical protein